MFCIDGVSTIYVVGHTDLVCVIAGDLCAVLLVRALYPQLQGTVEIFPDLNYAVAATLVAALAAALTTARTALAAHARLSATCARLSATRRRSFCGARGAPHADALASRAALADSPAR